MHENCSAFYAMPTEKHIYREREKKKKITEIKRDLPAWQTPIGSAQRGFGLFEDVEEDFLCDGLLNVKINSDLFGCDYSFLINVSGVEHDCHVAPLVLASVDTDYLFAGLESI